jgi:hypothetical protein
VRAYFTLQPDGTIWVERYFDSEDDAGPSGFSRLVYTKGDECAGIPFADMLAVGDGYIDLETGGLHDGTGTRVN